MNDEKYGTGTGTSVRDMDTENQAHDAHDKVHPVGSGVGAAAGAATGAAVGTAAGGLVGHGIAEGVNPTVEDAYWRENYRNRPYVKADRTYDDYQPAYRYGWESRAQAGNRSWDDVEPELGRNWNDYNRGAARQTWDEAKFATKDAWHRVERAIPGDADRDGR
jgi:hypothetical protein